MKRTILMAFLLCACQPESQQSLAPVALTAEAVGHFCQMNLLEHPGPKAQIHLEGLPGAPLFFSQVSDAIAYIRLPEQSHPILAVWVTDMGASGVTWDDPGADNWVDAATAHFVVGSASQGGMGAPEVVPFAQIDAALAFVAQNGGSVMSLDAIPDEAVIAPLSDAGGDDAEYTRRLRALSQKTGG